MVSSTHSAPQSLNYTGPQTLPPHYEEIDKPGNNEPNPLISQADPASNSNSDSVSINMTPLNQRTTSNTDNPNRQSSESVRGTEVQERLNRITAPRQSGWKKKARLWCIGILALVGVVGGGGYGIKKSIDEGGNNNGGGGSSNTPVFIPPPPTSGG